MATKTTTTTTKTPARTRKTTTTTTTTNTAYDPALLPATAQQYRLNSGGTGTPGASAYAQAIRTLTAWAGTGDAKPYVHALVHLGWCSGSGARVICRASNSSAFKHSASVLAVGEVAAPQICTTLSRLAEAGAPAEALATVWTTFTAE